MTETTINLVIIGENESILKNQLSILSSHTDIKSKQIIPARKIFDAINKCSQDKNNIVIINLTDNSLKELQFLNDILDKKATFIIIGDQKNVDLLSLAIHAGVKGFIHSEDYVEKLDGIFSSIKRNITAVSKSVKRIIALIGPKGGSGVSTIATNIAYELSKNSPSKVALIDLDVQFGSIGQNFDKSPKYTLLEAINAVDDLDSTSLAAYMVKYNENLSILLPSPVDIVLPGEINVLNLKKLIELVQINYSHIIVDLPRIIDPVSSLILEQADQITMVLQQTLAHFMDGRLLIQLLNKDLEIPLDKINIVVNRYDPAHSLRIDDLKNLVNHERVYTISSDYERVSNAANMGVPLCESLTKAKLTQELKSLAKNLGNIEVENESDNLFGRLKTLFK